MPGVSETLRGYFQILSTYHRASEWQKAFMLKGEILTACNTTTPEAARSRLRRFWYVEATKHGVEIDRLKNWK